MSSCDCDYDPPEFFTERFSKSRKLRRCGECGCDIRPGEMYENVAGKWDGIFRKEHTCERCMAFRDWYMTNRPCMCWSYGGVFEDVCQDIHEDASTMLAEAPGFLFEVGRRYVAIRKRARADRAARKESAAIATKHIEASP